MFADPASMVEAAQKAVGDGDYPAAERLLREAAAMQEATLGASHPDLASTLNNLAFVCERTSQFAEAERGYRRAHAIAVASLRPGHPFIATSLKNLLEFCAAQGIPIWKPPATRSEDDFPLLDAGEDQLEASIVSGTVARPPHAGQFAAIRLPPRVIAVAAFVAVAIVVGVFARQGQGTASTSPPVTATRQARLPDAVAATSTPIPVPPNAPTPTVTPERRDSTSLVPVTVLNAGLCSALEKRGSPDWLCAPASGDLSPGTYVFYTRLLTNANTTVEHRWYRGDRVHQVIRLRVTASPGNGYRTFSTTTISPERAGDWKVELRAADGSLVQEERFVVR
jgi:hypothetical protein